MAVSSPGRLRRTEASSMRKSLDEFLVFLAVEKGSASNTIAAYKNDLQQLADYIGPRQGSNGWQTLSRSDLQELVQVVRSPEGPVIINLGPCRFVPLMGPGAWSSEALG